MPCLRTLHQCFDRALELKPQYKDAQTWRSKVARKQEEEEKKADVGNDQF